MNHEKQPEKYSREYWLKRMDEEAILEQYIADILDDEEMIEFEKYLSQNEDARRELETRRNMDRMISDNLAPVRSAPGLASRIAHYAGREVFSGARRTTFHAMKLPLQVAAAMLLMAGLGFALQTHGKGLSADQEVVREFGDMGQSRKVMDGLSGLFRRKETAVLNAAPDGYAGGSPTPMKAGFADAEFAPPPGDTVAGALIMSLNENAAERESLLHGRDLRKDSDANWKSATAMNGSEMNDDKGDADYANDSDTVDQSRYQALKNKERSEEAKSKKMVESKPGAEYRERANVPSGAPRPMEAAQANAIGATAELPKMDSMARHNADSESQMAKSMDAVAAKDEKRVSRDAAGGGAGGEVSGESPKKEQVKQDERLKNLKLIRNADAEFEVDSYNATLERVRKIADEAGGFIASENSLRMSNGKIRGTIVVRVLPENFDLLIQQLRGIGDLKGQSIRSQDVTKEYFDIAARIRNQQVYEKSLLDMIAKREGKVEELLKVQQELAKVREEIERLQGQIQYYDSVVGLSTIQLTLTETGITDAGTYVKRQSATMTSAAKNVGAAYQEARAAAEEFKARIVMANHRDDPEGKNSTATLQLEVKAAQFLPLMEKLKAIKDMVIAHYDIQSQDVAQGGKPGVTVDNPRTEEAPATVSLNFIQLNPFYKESAGMTAAAPSVPEAFNKIKEFITGKDNKGVIRTADLKDNVDENQVYATIEFEIPSERLPMVKTDIRNLVRVLDIQEGGTPVYNGRKPLADVPGNTMAVVRLTISKLQPVWVRHANLTSEVADVAKVYEDVVRKLIESTEGAKTTQADLQRQGDKITSAQLAFDVKFADYDRILGAFKDIQEGRVIDLQVQVVTQIDEEREKATPGPKPERRASIAFRLGMAQPILLKAAEIGVRVADVEAKFREAETFVHGVAGAKILTSQLDSAQAQSRKGVLLAEFPADKFDQAADQFMKLGAKISYNLVTENKNPDLRTPGAKQIARIQVTLTDEVPAFSDKGGAGQFLKGAFKSALEFFLGSFGLILQGVGFIVPFLVAIWLFMIPFKLGRKKAPAKAPEAGPKA